MTGKTSKAIVNAASRAAGVPPWAGAEARPIGRALYYSLDESVEQFARRANSLGVFHTFGRLERYAERLSIIGPDRDVDSARLEALRFDARGLARLERWLVDAANAGAPFVEVYVDALSDVVPIGETENSNAEGTRIGGALERLAVHFGCSIVVLHHTAKPVKGENGDALPDVRHLGRGASAYAAKARVIASLELLAGLPHLRRIRTVTNLGPTPPAQLFEVCPDSAQGEQILYFRPAADGGARDPRDVLGPDEEINSTDLARRLAGESLPEDAPIPGDVKRLAAVLREAWRAAGKVIVTNGPRGAKLVKLAPREVET